MAVCSVARLPNVVKNGSKVEPCVSWSTPASVLVTASMAGEVAFLSLGDYKPHAAAWCSGAGILSAAAFMPVVVTHATGVPSST